MNFMGEFEGADWCLLMSSFHCLIHQLSASDALSLNLASLYSCTKPRLSLR